MACFFRKKLSEKLIDVSSERKKGTEIALKVKDDIEAIEVGIDVEKDSILFYGEMKKLAPKDGYKTIDKLIEQEWEPLRKLSELKRSLKSH